MERSLPDTSPAPWLSIIPAPDGSCRVTWKDALGASHTRVFPSEQNAAAAVAIYKEARAVYGALYTG